MPALLPTADPCEVGVDPARLRRVDDLLHGYVDDGRLPGTQVLVARRGEIVHHDVYGYADVEAGRPLEADAIFRIYSMTKPVTSVALMMLYEEGRVLLEDPIERYLPAFAEPRVWVGGDALALVTRPAPRSIRVKDLLTHTAGLTYGFQHAHLVDSLYRTHALGDFGVEANYTNAEMVELLATLPLQYAPGESWCYSMATDVCGALVEAISGQSLDEFFQSRVFEPLGMVDTGFWVDADRAHRLTANYVHLPTGKQPIETGEASAYLTRPAFLSGGGGLVSTMADYYRFTRCLAGGGALDGVRVLSPRTLDYMTTNHLPGGRTLNEMGQIGFSEVAMDGVGFGLGFSVNVDPVTNGALGSVGDFGWGGAASTMFSIDPVEELTTIFLTQLMPSTTFPIRRQLRATVYQSLLD